MFIKISTMMRSQLKVIVTYSEDIPNGLREKHVKILILMII
ncbi:9407_t:CDS:2 [Paraglomus brasilianum]|uniref:9407_t:CDS:1 n=1 Tax=Paraglomus brasilianum TaxID=144538 RepID=A0A9N8ZIU9_9GLOM|nr:9407_t:CDS:2 [Paraglomus brasilianum]